mmetsp:Transcript_5488/g.11876  ORF Transcript_5488/g.11876 Transcript_5488/m.11876 type:complete len:164 (-) Transcript_5488:1095-1586(-)
MVQYFCVAEKNISDNKGKSHADLAPISRRSHRLISRGGLAELEPAQLEPPFSDDGPTCMALGVCGKEEPPPWKDAGLGVGGKFPCETESLELIRGLPKELAKEELAKEELFRSIMGGRTRVVPSLISASAGSAVGATCAAPVAAAMLSIVAARPPMRELVRAI